MYCLYRYQIWGVEQKVQARDMEKKAKKNWGKCRWSEILFNKK